MQRFYLLRLRLPPRVASTVRVRHLVDRGPRPPGSNAIRQAQSYIIEQLKSYGCHVEEHDFHASTPVGDLPMKNIIAKIPGTGPGVVSSSPLIMTPWF